MKHSSGIPAMVSKAGVVVVFLFITFTGLMRVGATPTYTVSGGGNVFSLLLLTEENRIFRKK